MSESLIDISAKSKLNVVNKKQHFKTYFIIIRAWYAFKTTFTIEKCVS